jgi:hypothetical protein
MAKFRDNDSRDWPIFLTTDLIKDVRRKLEIDLADLNGHLYTRLADDPVLLVDTLWVLCEAEAKGRDVSPAAFAKALAGDPIEDAVNALVEAITDFFPTRRRSLLRAAAAKTRTARDKAYEMAMAKLDDPTTEAKFLEAMQARMEADLQDALTRLRGPISSPVSSESSPAPKASESSG